MSAGCVDANSGVVVVKSGWDDDVGGKDDNRDNDSSANSDDRDDGSNNNAKSSDVDKNDHSQMLWECNFLILVLMKYLMSMTRR